MYRFLFAVGVCLTLMRPVQAGWGGPDCGPVGPSAPVFSYQWVRSPQWPQIDLWYGNIQLGAIQLPDGDYFRRVGPGDWRGPTDPPIAPPIGVRRVTGSKPNYGIDEGKVAADKHILNGKPASKKAILDALKASVPADKDKLRLTLIGPENVTAAVLADLKAIPEAANLIVQAFTPDAWQVANSGFVTTGNPSIYLLQPDGKVLHHQDDYAGGAEALASALRDANSNYDPKLDPDLRKKNVLEFLTQIPTEWWLVAAVVVFLFLRKGQKQ